MSILHGSLNYYSQHFFRVVLTLLFASCVCFVFASHSLVRFHYKCADKWLIIPINVTIFISTKLTANENENEIRSLENFGDHTCMCVDIFLPAGDMMIGTLSNFYEWSFLCEYSKQNLSIHYDGNGILFICVTLVCLCRITTSGIKKTMWFFLHSGNQQLKLYIFNLIEGSAQLNVRTR